MTSPNSRQASGRSEEKSTQLNGGHSPRSLSSSSGNNQKEESLGDWLLWRANVFVSAITSLTFAFFAFGDPQKYGDSDWWWGLVSHPFTFAFSLACGISNFLISTFSHLKSIPSALQLIWNRIFNGEYWKNNWHIAIPVILLSLGASIAAGAVGFAAMAKITFLGSWAAYVNAVISGLIFFVTRLNGLFGIADKLDRRYKKQHECMVRLEQLKNRHRAKLNKFILDKTTNLKVLNEEVVTAILKETLNIMAADSKCLNTLKPLKKSSFSTTDWIMHGIGAITAIDVFWMFGERFGQGCDLLFGWHPSIWLNPLFAISSSILYFNNAVTIPEAFEPFRKALKDKDVPPDQKTSIKGWLLAALAMNTLAARGIRNLVISTTTAPGYSYPLPILDGPGTPDSPSTTTQIAGFFGGAGVFNANGKFVLQQLKDSLLDSHDTNKKKLTVNDVIDYLGTKNPLKNQTIAHLDDYAQSKSQPGLFSPNAYPTITRTKSQTNLRDNPPPVQRNVSGDGSQSLPGPAITHLDPRMTKSLV